MSEYPTGTLKGQCHYYPQSEVEKEGDVGGLESISGKDPDESLECCSEPRWPSGGSFSCSHFCKAELNPVFKATLNLNTSQGAQEPLQSAYGVCTPRGEVWSGPI